VTFLKKLFNLEKVAYTGRKPSSEVDLVVALLKHAYPGPPPLPQEYINKCFEKRHEVHCPSNNVDKITEILKQDLSNLDFEGGDEDHIIYTLLKPLLYIARCVYI